MTYFGCIPYNMFNPFGCFMMPNYFMLGAMQGYNSSMFRFMFSNPSIFTPQTYLPSCNSEINYDYASNMPSYPNFGFTLPQPPQVPQIQVPINYSIPQYEYSPIQPTPFDFTYGDIFGPPCTTGYSNWDTVFNDFISGRSNQNLKSKADNSSENKSDATSNQKISGKIDATNLDSKLGEGFTQKVKQIAKEINCDWEDLLGVMQAESGLNPKAWNGNSAVGLIQFTQIAIDSLNKNYDLNLTKEKISNMSANEQLDYVEKYLKLTKSRQFGNDKKLSSGDLYALIFLPGRAGKEVLTSSGENYYAYNKGLDLDHDNTISKQDLINQVNRKKLEIFA